jgi:hypothetical protein
VGRFPVGWLSKTNNAFHSAKGTLKLWGLIHEMRKEEKIRQFEFSCFFPDSVGVAGSRHGLLRVDRSIQIII